MGCFHLAAIENDPAKKKKENNAAMNTSVHIAVKMLAFNSFVYISGSGLAGSLPSFIFNYLGNHIVIFISAAPFYILTNSVQGF